MTTPHPNSRPLLRLLTLWLLLVALPLGEKSAAQTAERWFQVEVSIFSNEALADRAEEYWQADRTKLDYPDRIRRLDELIQLLLIDGLRTEPRLDLEPLEPILEAATEPAQQSLEQLQQATAEQALLAIGPHPARPGGDFKFYDLKRDPYLALPPSESDFQQTNRAIERSAEHRLLFHGLWRQAVLGQEQALPIYVEGGLQYGDRKELQGSLTIRFNDNADRVVVDADLWLSEFSIVADPDSDWQIPPLPPAIAEQATTPEPDPQLAPAAPEFNISRVFHMQQSRDMRSTEFHYLDHPALGIVILVEPYEVPEIPLPELEFDSDL